MTERGCSFQAIVEQAIADVTLFVAVTAIAIGIGGWLLCRVSPQETRTIVWWAVILAAVVTLVSLAVRIWQLYC